MLGHYTFGPQLGNLPYWHQDALPHIFPDWYFGVRPWFGFEGAVLMIFRVEKIMLYGKGSKNVFFVFLSVFVVVIVSATTSYMHFGAGDFLFGEWFFLTASMVGGVVLLAAACVIEGENLGALPVLFVMFSIPLYLFYRFFKTHKITPLIFAVLLWMLEGWMATFGVWV